MDTKTFWSLIDDARQNGLADDAREYSQEAFTQRHEYIVDKLSQLADEEIFEVNRIFQRLLRQSYRADLWDAVALVTCGCGDDSFYDFQHWLIAQGQTIFEKTLEDPENLVDIVDEKQRFQIYDGWPESAALSAYERKTGKPIPAEEYGLEGKRVLIGGPLTDEENWPAKYPRIRAKLGDCSDPDFV